MRFQKPTPDEVTRYAYKIGFVLDGNVFCDFYESKGWMVGKSPMKVWEAAVRTWKAKEPRMERWGDPKPKQAPPDEGKLAAAKARMDAIREREFEKRELVRLAQERDDARSRKMVEAAGEKEESGMSIGDFSKIAALAPIKVIVGNLKDENGEKWEENEEHWSSK